MKLIWLNWTYFMFIDKTGRNTATGTLKTVVKAMMSEGIPFSEIQCAIEEFEEKDHNVADFGVYKRTLLYTEYRDEYNSSKASA